MDPAGQKYPAAHDPLHVSTDTPATDPNRPAGHAAVQFDVVSPLLFPNRPAAQSVHTPCRPVLYFPGTHTAAVALVDPAAHAYPAAQSPLHVATDTPGVDPNCPATHVVHTPAPPSEYVPAGQMDAVAFVDPATHAYPALQFPLHAADDRPGAPPYRPAAHADVHAAVVRPVTFPKRPTGQSTHSPHPDTLYRPTLQMLAVAVTDPATQ